MSADPKSKPASSQVILHPILIAVYPAVFLYSANSAVFDFSVAFVPALCLAAFAAFVWFGLTRLTGDVRLASLLTSLPLLGFFSFGAIGDSLGAGDAGTWKPIVAAGFAAACLAVLALLKWRHLIEPVSYLFNVLSLLLVAAPLLLYLGVKRDWSKIGPETAGAKSS